MSVFHRYLLADSNIFTSLRVGCHGSGGKGLTVEGTNALAAPPLTESKRINSDKANLVKISYRACEDLLMEKDILLKCHY